MAVGSCCGATAIRRRKYALSPELIGKIHLPETCANLCFGGKKKNRLFMAASTSVYPVYVETVGPLVPQYGRSAGWISGDTM